MAIQSFTPLLGHPRFGSLAYPTVVPVSASNDIVLTAAQLLGGLLIQSKNGATNNTLPAASAISAAIPAPAVGMSFDFALRNTGNNTATVVVGTGINSVTGNTLTVATVNTRLFRLVCTGVASQAVVGSSDTYDLYSLGVSAH